MRIHIEGHNTVIAAPVLGWVAERLGDLNAMHPDIVSAVVILKQRQRRAEAQIELVLTGKTLSRSQRHQTQGEAVHAALQDIERQLAEFRTQQGKHKTRLPYTRGRILHLLPERDAGVIQTDAGEHVYFQAHTVQGIAFDDLHVDMAVAVERQSGADRWQAARVMPYWM